MSRIHLFEFEDFQWFPDAVRRGMTDFLRFMIEKTEFYEPTISLIKELLQKSDERQIVDLCSGGGGAIGVMAAKIDAKFILTDLYPNLEAFTYLAKQNSKIEYIEGSVDATDVPENLRGLRTIFSSFHHFKPEIAKAILADAARKQVPIAVFDSAKNQILPKLLFAFLLPLVVLVTTPFIRPFRWSRLLITYLIPLIPIFTMWDGIISLLRLYSDKDLKEMAATIESEHYTFETGILKGKTAEVQYIKGFPIT